MSVVDTVVAYKFIRLLSTPWKNTDAFKLGIIDDKGNILKKRKDLKTSAEKNAYTIFHTLCWNIKKLLDKLPPTKTRLGSFATALWLLKEYLNLSDSQAQKLFESAEDYFCSCGIDVRMKLLEGAKKKTKLRKGRYILKSNISEELRVGDTVIVEHDSFPIAEVLSVPLYIVLHEGRKKKYAISKYEIKEQNPPANNVGTGNIAGTTPDTIGVYPNRPRSINRRRANRSTMQSLTGIRYPEEEE